MLNKSNLPYILLSVLFAAVYYFIFDPKWDLNGDNANYYILASGLIEGKGYVLSSLPHPVAFNHYPPGYPMILAFFMLFLGGNLIALKVANGLIFLVSILLLHKLFKPLLNNSMLVFLISAILLLNVRLLETATILMSEPSFLLFILLTIYCLVRWDAEAYKTRSYWQLGFIVSLVATYYIRSIGITLLAAVLLHFFIDKRWKEAGTTFAGFVLLYLPYSLRNSYHGLQSRYFGTVMSVNPWRPEEGTISDIGDFFSKMMINFDDAVIMGFSEVLFPFLSFTHLNRSTLGGIFAGLVVLGIILYGAWRIPKWRFLIGGFILANIGILMIWHTGNEARYVVPITPILAICFYFGLYEIGGSLMKDRAQVAKLPLAIIAFSPLMLSPLKTFALRSHGDYPPEFRNYLQIAVTLREKAPENIIVSVLKSGLFHVMSDRKVVGYRFSQDDKVVIQGLVDDEVDYVVLADLGYSSTTRYLAPAINKNFTLFSQILRIPNPDTFLLQFHRARAEEMLRKTDANAE